MTGEFKEDGEPVIQRRKKKIYLANLHQQEIRSKREAAETSWYLDQAKECRDGVNQGYKETELISTVTNYKAVGPNEEADSSTEKRKQLIWQSQFLGGDIEHTHLVKGLDFSLLEKVHAEIASRERERERETDEKGTEGNQG
ncbi:Protein Red [Heterocephalus glaber]|uniref:Protein Red n=1 Tax=Heterocephalus glaber TaxID=10181 RepID=G5B9K6_HETGA|nr:Protein Red [Heterocephalus glaber]